MKRKGIHEEDRERGDRRIRRRMGRMRKGCVLLTSDFESEHVAKTGERDQQRLSWVLKESSNELSTSLTTAPSALFCLTLLSIAMIKTVTENQLGKVGVVSHLPAHHSS